MKKLFALLLAVLMVVGLFAGCVGEPADTTPKDTDPADTSASSGNQTQPSEDPEAAKYGGTFTLGWTPGDTLDPMKTTGSAGYNWGQNVYETVISRDVKGDLAPGVCEFEVSKDNLKLTLWVREGVKFHDGTEVEIEDVQASIQRASQTVPRVKENVTPYLKSMKIEGDKLVIEFTEYSINTLWWLSANQAWTVVLPKEICEKYGTENAIVDIADAIGTGPYKVTKFEPGVEVVMERFDGYVPVAEGRTGVAAPKKAYFDKMIMRAMGESQVDYMELVSGLKDLLWMDSSLEQLYLDAGLIVEGSDSASFYSFNFNCDGNSITSNPNVRKAIAAAIDASFLLEMSKRAKVGAEYTTPVTGAYSTPKYSAADYAAPTSNIELAKSYLAKAGYNGEPVVLLMANGSGDIEPYLRPSLEAAGITFEVKWMEQAAMEEYAMNPENDWGMRWGGASVVELPTTLVTRFWKDHYTNEELQEKMTEMGKLAPGSAESVAIWNEIDAILAEDCPSYIVGYLPAKEWAYNADLVWDQEGIWDYWWNSYWKNPEDHNR